MSGTSSHVVVIGSGAAGLSAAWLLSKNGQRVTLLESEDRLGGHAHTASVRIDPSTLKATLVPFADTDAAAPGLQSLSDGRPFTTINIDTGFIVFNEPCYPNLTRWFAALGVPTEESDMSFSVSRHGGAFEYAGGPIFGLLAQRSLPFKRRFWRMLRDLVRFYRQAPGQISAAEVDAELTLGQFLREHGYCDEFVDDHLLPFGAAIWSTPKADMLDYPAINFIRFCENHGLLKLSGRPQWRTVSGGSVSYVSAVETAIGTGAVIRNFTATKVVRTPSGVTVYDRAGEPLMADQVVFATHADQALNLLDQPSDEERRLLSPFQYESNRAVLHTDASYLPVRRRAWCSWNYVEAVGQDPNSVAVSYWMNRLQNLACDLDFVVTLNPVRDPAADSVVRVTQYRHPKFTTRTSSAQRALWTLQGQQRSWFCGSYFGAGFHEDAVQSGLAVAEQLGACERPWRLSNPSSRISVGPQATSDVLVGVETLA